jgi:hypothetical protein
MSAVSQSSKLCPESTIRSGDSAVAVDEGADEEGADEEGGS